MAKKFNLAKSSKRGFNRACKTIGLNRYQSYRVRKRVKEESINVISNAASNVLTELSLNAIYSTTDAVGTAVTAGVNVLKYKITGKKPVKKMHPMCGVMMVEIPTEHKCKCGHKHDSEEENFCECESCDEENTEDTEE